MSIIAPWAIPGNEVRELHCSTHDYSTKKVIATTVATVGDGALVLANGARYSLAEGSATGGAVSYYRDDPKTHRRYYLLVEPGDPRVEGGNA